MGRTEYINGGGCHSNNILFIKIKTTQDNNYYNLNFNKLYFKSKFESVIMAKVIVIVISKEPEKINLALNFVERQQQAGQDMRLLFFGQSEIEITTNNKINNRLLTEFKEKPKACSFIAKNSEIEEQLSKITDLIPAGRYITKSIEEGYIPLTI